MPSTTTRMPTDESKHGIPATWRPVLVALTPGGRGGKIPKDEAGIPTKASELPRLTVAIILDDEVYRS
jgi:hypothetical protein